MARIISTEKLHELVNSKKVRKVQLVDHVIMNNITYDVWVIIPIDSDEIITYYIPQSD